MFFKLMITQTYTYAISVSRIDRYILFDHEFIYIDIYLISLYRYHDELITNIKI
jgi:hypothetical protein